MIVMPNRNSHDEVWSLLPWYVNGTLDGLDSARVRRHLRVCSVCSAELEEQHALRARIQSKDALELNCDAALSKFKSRLQHEVQPAQCRKASGISTFVSWFAPRWQFSALTAVAAGLIVAALVPRETTVPGAAALNRFHTAANPSNDSQLGASDVRVVFARPLDQAAIEAILLPLRGRLIDGPKGDGIYTIRFDDTVSSSEDVSLRLRRLRANKDVALAERAIPVSGTAD